MDLQIRHLIFLLLIFMRLIPDSYAMEEEEDKAVKIPPHLSPTYNQLKEKDQKQIDELYRDPPIENKLTFVSCPGLNAKYNKDLIKCLNKENNFIRKLILSHLMGGVTFESLFPILPRYNCLKTLDISTNNISEKMIQQNITSFKELKNLRKLLMGSNKIEDEGFKLIFKLFNSEEMNLSYLSLEKNKINVKDATDYLLETGNIKIERLNLFNQKYKDNANNDDDYLADADYETFIFNLSVQFPHFRCILREKDKRLLIKPGLPLERLIVASLTDTLTTAITTTKKNYNEEGKALKLPNSPIKKSVPKNKWSKRSSRCIMAIDPSGDGSDATGYAVIKANKDGEYLIIKAKGIKGDGLADETFEKLLKVVQEEDVETVVIESNYHEGAYLTAFKYYCKLQNALKMLREGKKPENYPEEMGLKFTLKPHKTREKDKGQRIVSTLAPLLISGKLFIEETFFYKDWHRNDTPSLYREMSWIKKDFKSQAKEDGRHDDLVDALEMAISFSKSILEERADIGQLGIANLQPLHKIGGAVAPNKDEEEQNATLTNQQFDITNEKIIQVVKYIYEQTGGDKKKTAKYIGLKNEESKKISTLMKGTAYKKSWETISHNLDTLEKVHNCLKESGFTPEQFQDIFDILNS